MVYDLRHADTRLRWLVTCLLGTFGVAYLFGAWMVGLYAGFTPRSVAATYRGPEMPMCMPPETTVVVEPAHTVDRDLLVQDTHVHIPMYGVIAAALSAVVLGLVLPSWAGFGLITLLFAAPWLDFAGMWLTKLVAPGFALVTLAGGWAMGLGYGIVTALAMWQMWTPKKGVAG